MQCLAMQVTEAREEVTTKYKVDTLNLRRGCEVRPKSANTMFDHAPRLQQFCRAVINMATCGSYQSVNAGMPCSLMLLLTYQIGSRAATIPISPSGARSLPSELGPTSAY